MKIFTSLRRQGRGGPGSALRVSGAVIMLCLAVSLAAQQSGFREGWNAPIREGLPEKHGGFTFCRLLYTSVRSEEGGLGWSTDYPGSDINFMIRLEQFTTTHISKWKDGEPGHA